VQHAEVHPEQNVMTDCGANLPQEIVEFLTLRGNVWPPQFCARQIIHRFAAATVEPTPDTNLAMEPSIDGAHNRGRDGDRVFFVPANRIVKIVTLARPMRTFALTALAQLLDRGRAFSRIWPSTSSLCSSCGGMQLIL
jgi:hypothetical protein